MQRFLVLALVASVSGAISCGADDVGLPVVYNVPLDTTVRTVVVVPADATLKPGDQLQLTVSVDAGPAATNRSVTWTSSDTAIASVNQTGLVTSRTESGGVVVVKAASNRNPSISGSSTISVAVATP